MSETCLIDRDGQTPMHWAAFNGNIEVMQIFDITRTSGKSSFKATYLDRYVHCNSSCLAVVVLQFHESLLCM